MTLQHLTASNDKFQRARGRLVICAKSEPDKGTQLGTIRQEGSSRAIFPRPESGALDAVIINTAGGVTGGDRFSTKIEAQGSARITITTQAAERIYKASGADAGHLRTKLSVAEDAQLHWLPQETILFDGSRLVRHLDVELAPTSEFLMLEPLVFGRKASGENLRACVLHDEVSIKCAEKPIYLDRVRMDGNLADILSREAVGGNHRAMANIVYVVPTAGGCLSAVRDLLPVTGGASQISDNVMVIRLLAEDSFALRKSLLPILTLLTRNALPRNWRL